MTSNPPRVFTLEEASALLPRLNASIGEQMERRDLIEERLAALGEETGTSSNGLAVHPGDRPEVRTLKREIVGRLQQYQTTWNEIEDIGIVIKDPRIGLVDFYSRIDGKLVFLCWRYGEPAITHYHDVEAGFAGRKPIEGAVRTRMYN